ncbi:MAG TPA: nitronate monooxygenase [Rhizomicrobium sp.]|nr:nitronate monooxygenase [Rhizomicrobium sp.]
MNGERKRFLDRLGIAHPIIQAPMAGVSTPAMAAAVSNAGALGSLGLGADTAESAARAITATRTLTHGPVHVNVFCHRPGASNARIEQAWIAKLRPEFERYGAAPPTQISEIYQSFIANSGMLQLFLESKPEIVSFHFGLPASAAIEALRQAGIVLIASATNVREAIAIAEAGLDAVIAQGYEAGGHRGAFDPDAPDDALGTFALTRLLAASLEIPVIAAGGIMDGAGIAAALRLGASAAQLGTAFIACPESLADSGYRAALASDAAHHTLMTRAISGRPARCLANKFTAIGERVASSEIPAYPIAYDAGKSLHAAAKARGEFGFGAQWAGQGAPLARMLAAGALVEQLIDELAAAN